MHAHVYPLHAPTCASDGRQACRPIRDGKERKIVDAVFVVVVDDDAVVVGLACSGSDWTREKQKKSTKATTKHGKEEKKEKKTKKQKRKGVAAETIRETDGEDDGTLTTASESESTAR
jgi:hypothetical protein